MKKNKDPLHELIRNGVKKLRLFGFTNVTEENIMTDEVYRLYFERILRSGFGNQATPDEIAELIARLKNKS